MLTDVVNQLIGNTWTPLVPVTLLLVLVLAWKRQQSVPGFASSLPPTPGFSLPIVGHLYLMEKDPRRQFKKWAEQLGPIFQLQFGSRTVVVLNGYDVLKEAFVRKAEYFSDRPQTFLCDVMAKNSGFVSSTPHWRNLRKVTVDILRQLGSGAKEMEGRIQPEATRFLNTIRDSNQEPLDIRDLTATCLSNVIGNFVFGKEFSPEDSELADCVRMIGDQVSLMEGAIILNFLPFLMVLPGDCFGLKKAATIVDELDNIVAREIELRKKEMLSRAADGGSPMEVEDFIAAFLQRMEKHKQKENNDAPSGMDVENLIGVLKSLFAAGTETTSSTICWAVLYLLHHPDILNRCYKELLDVLGPDQLPTSQHRSHCRYLEATIMETQRLSSISPFSIYHTASADVQLGGFLIPRGSIIMPSLDSVLHSTDIWGDPGNFRPERFLDDVTGQIIRREELVPFSLGKRACLGESMAKQEMFLFLASLIHQFDFKTPIGAALPPLEYRFGLNCSPTPYEICFIPR